MLKNRIRHTIICALLLLAAIPAWAGITYPVSLTAQLLPPYSNCLSDYANGSGMNRLVVNALLRDLNHPSYDVTIRLTVRQGSRVVLETNSGATQPYRLMPGMFTPIDPKQLLDPRNATAGDRYASNGFCLPEGGYELVLQAFDAHNRNVPLSEPQRIFTYLSKSQPPIPTFPQDGACVSESSPTITFSWMDAIATSPSTDKKFLLEIFEMPEGFGEDGNFNSDKNAMLLSGAKKVYAETLEGFINSHIVPVTAGTFLKGHTYVWRVRAFCPSRESVTNQNGTVYGTSDYYENGGYSTVSSFTFKHCAGMSAFEMLAEEPKVDESVAPELLRIDLVTGPSAVWRNEPDKFPDGYVVEYNTSSETAEWSRIEVGPTESSVVLPGIAQGVKYVVRVKGIKHDSNGETVYTGYSNKLSLQLPEKEEVDCKRNQVPTLTSTEPIESLSIGQTITANGHDVMITTIEQNGDRFSGTGVATISFLGELGKAVGIKMRFENIRVNKNFELMEGTIVSISNPENSIDLNANGALNETYAGTGFEQQTASFGAESNTSTKLSGNKLSWEGSKGEMLVTDNDDIDTQCAPQENSIDDDKGRVVFSVDKDARLPFDDDKSPFTSNAINKYYTTYGTSFRYNVPWFALTENTTGQIIATFEGGDNSVGPNDIEFICRSAKQTVTLPSELIGNNTFRIQIFAGEVDKRLDIYAMAKANGAETCTNLTLGRAKLATLRNETKTLHIVPVLGAKVDKEAIQQKLNETYLPFGKKFEVVMEENFGTENDPEFEFLKDGLAIEGSGFMKTETEEMIQLKYLYNTNVGFKQNNTNSAQADHAYIFILPKAETEGVMGDMPRCKPVGYIFLDGNTDIPSTVAHEIGHGVFALEHTFEFGGAKQGETCKQSSRSNLMDYCSPQGNYLTAWQWNLLDTHKDYVIPFLEKDEDEMLRLSLLDFFTEVDFEPFKWNDNKHAVLSPTGAAIIIPNITSAKFNKEGGVVTFATSSNGEIENYTSLYKSRTIFSDYGYNYEDADFLGYIKNGEFEKYKREHPNQTLDNQTAFVNKHRYKVQLAEIGCPTVAVAKKKINGKYTKCVVRYEWKNTVHSAKYTGRTTETGNRSSYYIPDNADEFYPDNNPECFNASALGLIDGIGAALFANLRKSAEQKNMEGDLVLLANYITETFSSEAFVVAMFDEGSKKFETGYGSFPPEFIKFMKDNSIFSTEAFKEKVYITNNVRGGSSVISNVDMWNGPNGRGVPQNYNTNSVDYVRSKWDDDHKTITERVLYQYSFLDLKIRYYMMLDNNVFAQTISTYESEGNAIPISAHDDTEQYVAIFGTRSAIFSLAEFFAKDMSDIFAFDELLSVAKCAGALRSLKKAPTSKDVSKLIRKAKSKANTAEIKSISSSKSPETQKIINKLSDSDHVLISPNKNGDLSVYGWDVTRNDFVEVAHFEGDKLVPNKVTTSKPKTIGEPIEVSSGTQLHIDDYGQVHFVIELDLSPLTHDLSLSNKQLNELRTKIASLNENATSFIHDFEDAAPSVRKIIAEEDDIISTWSKLKSSNSELRNSFNELIKHGVRCDNSGGKISLYSYKGSKKVIIAEITENTFTVKKWGLYYYGENIEKKLDNGYWLVKDKDGSYFIDLGFKKGRKLKGKEVNEYYTSSNKAAPYAEDCIVTEEILPSGKEVYMIIDGLETDLKTIGHQPGSWASNDAIKTIKELRHDLAVLSEWKQLNRKPTRIKYRVKQDLRVRNGIVGPQEENNVKYLGGKQQYEIITEGIPGWFGSNGWKSYITEIERFELLKYVDILTDATLKKRHETLMNIAIKQVDDGERIIYYTKSGKEAFRIENNKLVLQKKGERPNAGEYLSNEYIEAHLNEFRSEGKCSRIVAKKDYNKYGIGKPDEGKTEFVSKSSDIDALIKKCNGDTKCLGETLGLDESVLEGGLVRVDFDLKKNPNAISIPNGNEFGANSYWLPGGLLPTNQKEVVIRTEGMNINVDYKVIEIK